MSVWTTVSIGASLRVVLMTRVSVTVFGMVVLVGDLINSHFYLLDGATTHTPFNGPFSGTTQVGRYQKGKTNLDFTEARDSEWQWHQMGRLHLTPDR